MKSQKSAKTVRKAIVHLKNLVMIYQRVIIALRFEWQTVKENEENKEWLITWFYLSFYLLCCLIPTANFGLVFPHPYFDWRWWWFYLLLITLLGDGNLEQCSYVISPDIFSPFTFPFRSDSNWLRYKNSRKLGSHYVSIKNIFYWLGLNKLFVDVTGWYISKTEIRFLGTQLPLNFSGLCFSPGIHNNSPWTYQILSVFRCLHPLFKFQPQSFSRFSYFLTPKTQLSLSRALLDPPS